MARRPTMPCRCAALLSVLLLLLLAVGLQPALAVRSMLQEPEEPDEGPAAPPAEEVRGPLTGGTSAARAGTPSLEQCAPMFGAVSVCWPCMMGLHRGGESRGSPHASSAAKLCHSPSPLAQSCSHCKKSCLCGFGDRRRPTIQLRRATGLLPTPSASS
jgi:hypothetical protein